MAESDQQNTSPGPTSPAQPGSVIAPSGQEPQPIASPQAPPAEPVPTAPPPEPSSPAPTLPSPSEPAASAPSPPEPAPASDAIQPPSYDQLSPAVTDSSPYANEPEAPEAKADEMVNDNLPIVSWTADEFVAHEKTMIWYLGLFATAIVIAGVVYLLTGDILSTVVVIVAFLILGIYAAKRPRQVEYALDEHAISVAGHQYSYNDFRFFSVTSEGPSSGIVLMPLKRFALPLTLYCKPEDEDKIVAVIADQLPMEEHKIDAIDSLMRRIHF